MFSVLKFLYELDSNYIKFLNGELLRPLSGLTQVWMNGNECIDEDFKDFDAADLARDVSRRCSFCESEESIDLNVCEAEKEIKQIGTIRQLLGAKETQVLSLEISIQQLFTEKSDCLTDNEEKTEAHAKKSAENVMLLSRIARLESEVKFSRSQVALHADVLEQMKEKIALISERDGEIEILKQKVENLKKNGHEGFFDHPKYQFRS